MFSGERVGSVEERVGSVEERAGSVEERVGSVGERVGSFSRGQMNIHLKKGMTIYQQDHQKML